MKDFKLTIELLPKGAWGNDLSKTLPKKDWDVLRNACYQRADHKCEICGYETDDLDAHEVWEFDSISKTQTLKDIIGICSRCHGVKHFKNSVRMGFEEKAKAHFLKVNNCSEKDFANHLLKAVVQYEKNNEILRWHMVADLEKFGGKDIKVVQRQIPFIKNPYEKLDWWGTVYGDIKKQFVIEKIRDNFIGVPKILEIDVNNYQGTITLTTINANKIEWFLDSKKIKTNYYSFEPYKIHFSVENLEGKFLRFKMTNENGSITSQNFEFVKN